MSKASEFETIRKFRERVGRGNLTDDLKVIYHAAGGMPHERIEEKYILSGDGNVKAMMQDVLRSILLKEASVELDQSIVQEVFQQIGRGLDSLVPRSEARFIPDSVIGSITIQIGSEEATLYFLADEKERLAQNKPISPQMADVIQRFRGISQELLLKKGEEKDNE